MSVLIKGMKMPTSCAECPLKRDEHLPTECVFRRWYRLSCNDTPSHHETRDEWCPLVELQPHGRLIDADALRIKEFRYLLANGQESPKVVFANAIETAPTVIEAEVDG